MASDKNDRGNRESGQATEQRESTIVLVDQAADMLAWAKKVVIFTGAGVSKESGIPTFREAQTGLWANYDPEQLATPEGFQKDPKLVWRWYDWRRKLLSEIKPNPGHFAFAEMQKILPEVVVVTQNVDGLHKQAGSTDVIELHGSITRFYCYDKFHPPESDIPLGLEEPPKCHCGSLMRPGVVWFGEELPKEEFGTATTVMTKADVVLVAGTSGLVQPAASLPVTAKFHGAKIIEVNPEKSPIGKMADLFIPGASGEVMPLIVSRIKKKLRARTST